MKDYTRMLRELVGSQRIFVPGVRALIVNDAGELLLQRRTDVPWWGLPGGAVELDESALDALKREVAEETHLTVLDTEPMALYSGLEHRFTYANGDKVQCFAVAFIVRRWTGKPRADGVEGSDVRFFPCSELPTDLAPLHKPTIEDYRKYDGKFIVR